MGHYLDTLEHRKAFQTALNASLSDRLKPPLKVDGVLGDKTAAAVRLWRQVNNKPKGQANGKPLYPASVDDEMLRLLGLGPALITEPGTLGNEIALPIIELAASAVLPNIVKGLLPMTGVLPGYKTLILGVVTIIVGLLALLGWDIPGFQHVPGGITIDAGLAMIFLRLGIKNAVTDLLEKVVSGLGK